MAFCAKADVVAFFDCGEKNYDFFVRGSLSSPLLRLSGFLFELEYKQ